MIRSSRWGLGACALAVALTAAPARAAEVDKFLPAESESFIAVNVRQILDSEIVKKYALEQIKQALAGNDAQKAIQALGLDPLKDVDRVVVGATGDNPQDMKFLAVVHGKFDKDKLAAAAKEAADGKGKDHLTIVQDGGATLYKVQPENQPNPMYAAIVDNKTIVFGSQKAMVTDALGIAGGSKKGAGLKKDLAALVEKQDAKASLVICGVLSGKLDNLPPLPGVNDPSVKKNLEKMANVAATLRVTSDVNLEISLGMKDEDSADEFGKTIDQGLQQAKGLIPLLAAQNPQLKPLTELAQTLKSTTKSKDVTISAKLSGDAIGKMLGMGD